MSDKTWTWLKGIGGAVAGSDPTGGSTTGTVGVPDAANTPPAHFGSITWTDEATNGLWLLVGCMSKFRGGFFFHALLIAC